MKNSTYTNKRKAPYKTDKGDVGMGRLGMNLPKHHLEPLVPQGHPASSSVARCWGRGKPETGRSVQSDVERGQ